MAIPSTVTIGCKLPNGLILSLGAARHELAGTRASAVVGGYGLTPVPAEFWAAWSRAYADFPPLKNGLIFAQNTVEKATGQAREQATLRTGTEPLNPATPAPGITPV
ncbi:hypothetical protein [Acetobacter orleanensis]|uniref:Burkholderia phage Bcep781 gp09 n=1 Tax=Acetobacter orleanensis TaxID=104099 RepID=A0A4Y3TK77_9PROT|nr:hypothetical protein [Acetobacter orleanensis]KXV63954.1 hypothetical protein AD949_06550 [Acetobacter orleanensis]PCD79728.1 hypothetical protein CO710_05870 [Acetobacter orleanensis]GAN69296.1 hypothetical protein Abol_030_061 [Acetobacter orleanensis JCM 7639]GBR28317.1 hypothetical protein AA0473_1710 [Acetobacter orleanensis NRIC 0473]GEB82178.1 hypothetical protein AOR01nite_06550 [Acetobacter orleanensis]